MLQRVRLHKLGGSRPTGLGGVVVSDSLVPQQTFFEALDLVAAAVMPSFGTFFTVKTLFATFITVRASLGSYALR
jgi:hypothetical protein